ncbi:MAG: transporter substrate-binding domain-containing protein [Lachnospiraceae bacterium]
MKKKVLSVLLTIAMVLSLAACGGSKEPTEAAPATEASKEQDQEETTETEVAESTDETDAPAATEGTFTVGFDQDFPPMGFMGDDGEYTGFDLELAKEVADRLNLEFVPQPIAWDSKDMELEAGNIDCIWNGFTMNGREDGYTWTQAYMKNEQVFVVTEDSDVQMVADLTGKIVVVQADSSAEAALNGLPELVESFGGLQATPDYNTALQDLTMGATDAVAMDSIVANYQIEQRGGGYRLLDETLAAEEYGVGFKKGNEDLRDKVQTTLEEMAADGTMAEISTKWFSKDITTIGK